MAGASKKLRKAAEPDSGDAYESDESGGYHGQQEIQATFEGRNPEPQDFHGIKQLLHQEFLSTHIDMAQLSDMIISQAGIGSVLKQSTNDSDDEEDVDMVEESDVFGVTSVINLSQHKETPCVQQLCKYVDEECKKHSDETTQTAFKQVLNHPNKVGFLINERFVNIPSKISALMLNSLLEEITRMKKRDSGYNFDYYLMMCKSWRPKGEQNGDVLYSNDEEEIFIKNADQCFEYSVAGKIDTGLTGQWQSEDKELLPYRTVILFKSDKFVNIVNEIQSFVLT